MKKLLLSVLVVFFAYIAMAQQKQVVQLSALENKLELKSVTPESFSAKTYVKEMSFENFTGDNGTFSLVEVEGMTNPANVGQANLPVISKLIEVPHGAEIEVVIKSYDEQVINLNDYGISRIEPTQPSYSKSTSEDDIVFVIDEDYYSTDELESSPLIKTEISGIMRGVRMGRIEIRPWHYNPVENTLVVYNNLDFDVNFINADLGLTEEMKSKHYSSVFAASFTDMINYMPPASKDAFSDFGAPLKYVIVANRVFEATLQPFVEWKTKMGFNVIEAYTDVIGTTNTAIKTYLEGLYDAGTPSDPAPLYVLIIGDHSGNYSIPAFASSATTPDNSHITDVYFATYDGASDYIPDLYYGRISANTTTELQNALNKILPYEQYTIPDGTYLNNCMLIAGVDATYAKSHGDGTILYGIDNYYNEAHGFDNIYAYYHTYTSGPYHIMSSASTAADADVRSRFTSGIGFANYTAHCDYYGWGDPQVWNQHIADFNNTNEYPFLIANCCLSFQFNNSTDAFGEQVIYAANEGAIGYIGTSNSSYWNEDVYWGIGLTSIAITQANVPNHSYANTGLGAYDCSWHENGEAYSNWYYSGRQIAHKGNLAVEASTSTFKKYYWEIYHLSGDPSLIPYMTEPDPLSLSFTAPMVGDASLTVTTEPYTYVALSKDNVLLDAKWSGSGTSVTLNPPSNFNGDTYCVVGTKQDRSPYVNEGVVPVAPNPPVADFSGTPTTILEGQSVTFTDASQYATTWSWNFGDGQTSTEQNPVHVYTTAGTYTVSLTVTNPLPGTDTETKTNYITVNVNTNPPTANFVADQTNITPGTTVNFTDLSINNPASWSWTFDGGTPAASTDPNPSVVYSTPGVYDVTLTATNPYGSDDEIKVGYIVVTAPEPCSAGSDNTGYMHISNFTCNTINNDSGDSGYSDFTSISTDLLIGQTYSFSVTNGDAYSYDQCIVWVDWNCDGDFEDGDEQIYISAASGDGGPYTGTFTVPGTAIATSVYVRIRLHYTDTGFGANSTPCGTSGYGEVEDYMFNLISPTIPPTADFTSDVTSSCTGIVQFADLSLLADTWLWNFGDGNTSTEQNPLHTYTADGTFTVSLYVENAYGNDTYSITDMITIDMPEAPVTASVESCGPASLTLNAVGSGTLNWYDAPTGGNLVTTGTSYTNTFNNTTTLYVQSDIDNPVTESAGPVDNNFGTGGYFTNTNQHGLIFDAYQAFTLKTVKVYANSAGNRVIELRDASDNVIQSTTINIPSGESVITLNFDVPIGTDLKLMGPGSPNMYRNSAGASYPYNLDGVLSIHYNTADDAGYYYYFYDWQVEYNNSCSSSRTPVTATINTLPTVNLGSDVEQCGGSVVLDAGAGMTTYTWNGTVGSQTHTATTTNTYTVVVEDANGCTATDAVNVEIHSVPTVDLGSDQEQCGGSVVLDAGAGFSTYTWNGTVGSQTHTATVSGTYVVVAEDANGCTATDNVDITIHAEPIVNLGSDVEQCGGSVVLDAGSGMASYTWNGTIGSQTHTATTTNTYTVVVEDANGCTATDAVNVEIHSVPTVDLGSDQEQCGGSVVLDAGAGFSTYTWNGTVGSQTHTATVSGTYVVVAEDANGCTASDNVDVTINTLPTVNLGSDIEQCGGSVVLDAGAGMASYTWNGTVGSQTHTVSSTNTYTVVVEDANGCTATDAVNVTIHPSFTANAVASDETSASANDGSVTVTMTGGTAPFDGIWSPAGTTNTSGTSMTLDNLTGGYYSVVVEDANGCTATAGATVNTLGSAPVADFQADVTDGCDNLTVNFTDLTNNSPISWAWDFGDGNSSTDQHPTHTYSNPGTYTVVLEATNAVDSDTHTITDYIVVGETPVIALSMTEESLSGNDGTATVSNIIGGSAPYQYEWSNSSDLVTITGLVADEYCVTVTEANGCMTALCIDVTQEALPAPVADFEADITTGCGTLTVNFTDLSTNSPTSWYWEFGDGNTSDVQDPTYTYTTTGTYTVSLTVTNATDSDTHTITDYIVVGETPVLVLSMNPESSALNDGTATVNISNGTAPYSIEWSNSGDTETISGLSADNYCVTVTDAAGCFETACVEVTFEAGTLEPVADFEADVTETCGTATVNFTDLSLYSPTNWSWSFGDGGTSDEQSPTYTYTLPGVYTVTLNVSNAEGSDFETKIDYIVVHEMPVVTVDVTPASGEFIADGEATVNISGGAIPYDITWSNSDTGATSTGLLPGNYSVVVVDNNGCFTTTPFVVNWVNAVDENLMVYGIYPNPAKDEVFIQFEGQLANSVTVYDMLGKEIIELTPSTDINKLDISHLQIGVYFVKVTFDGKEFTHKLVIN